MQPAIDHKDGRWVVKFADSGWEWCWCCVVQEADRVIDRWLTTPQDELIPLMKHMFDYTIHTILFAVYDFNCEDPQLVTSVHDSYNVVSSVLLFSPLLQ